MARGAAIMVEILPHRRRAIHGRQAARGEQEREREKGTTFSRQTSDLRSIAFLFTTVSSARAVLLRCAISLNSVCVGVFSMLRFAVNCTILRIKGPLFGGNFTKFAVHGSHTIFPVSVAAVRLARLVPRSKRASQRFGTSWAG